LPEVKRLTLGKSADLPEVKRLTLGKSADLPEVKRLTFGKSADLPEVKRLTLRKAADLSRTRWMYADDGRGTFDRPVTTEEEIRRLVDASPTAREPNLVLSDWLSERGDPRGELGIVHDRLIEARSAEDHARARELLRVASDLVRAHLSSWLGFDVEVGAVVDVDRDLIVETDAGRADLRWSRIVGLSGGVDRVAMAFGRPAVALSTIHVTRALPGQLWRMLEGQRSEDLARLSVVGVSDTTLDEGDVRMMSGLPGLSGLFAKKTQGLDTARVAHLLPRLASLILVETLPAPSILYDPGVDGLEELVLLDLAIAVEATDLGRVAASRSLRRLALSPVRSLDAGVMAAVCGIRNLRSLELWRFPELSAPAAERIGTLGLDHVVLAPSGGVLPNLASSGIVGAHTVDVLRVIARLPFVRGVAVLDPAATDDHLLRIAELPDLRALDVRCSDRATGRFLDALPLRLSFLRIAGCPNLEPSRLMALAEHRSIRQLSLEDMPIGEDLLSRLDRVPLAEVRMPGADPDLLERFAAAHPARPRIVSPPELLVPDRWTFRRAQSCVT
jgi:hypothetical protein